MAWIEHPEGPGPYLGLDEAIFNISTAISASLFSLSVDCFHCPFQKVADLSRGWNELTLNVKRQQTFRIVEGFAENASSSFRLCDDVKQHMEEFGIYQLVINDKCKFSTIRSGVDTVLPLVAIVIGLILISVISVLTTYYIKNRNKRFSITMENIQPKPTSKRVEAIDTFRGISILVMIFVNDGAGGYWFLEHATWDGLNVGDLVFPWFMWIMGVCLPISIRGQLRRNSSRIKIIVHIIKRSAILFLLGLLVNTIGGNSSLETLRIPGVLQRFSLVYLILGTISACFTSEKQRFDGIFADIWEVSKHWILTLLLTGLYIGLAFYVEVPGCPTGYFGPGGLHDDHKYENCVGGMAGYVDKTVLGINHIYQWPTSREVYKSGPFDPEGILGILPSVLHVMFGVQAGMIILTYTRDKWKDRVIRWVLWGVLNAVLGASFAATGLIPINKNLWSLSFVFVTTSAAFFILSIIYLLQDHDRIWNGVPFKAPGMNPTLLYVGHSVASGLFPFHWSQGPMNTHFVRTMETLWGVTLWACIGYWLYFKKIFLSI